MKSDKNNNYGKMLLEYTGKWVALSKDESMVIASGRTLAETLRNVQKTKIKDPIYVMVSEEIGNFSFC